MHQNFVTKKLTKLKQTNIQTSEFVFKPLFVVECFAGSCMPFKKKRGRCEVPKSLFREMLCIRVQKESHRKGMKKGEQLFSLNWVTWFKF